jgi:hypothetical protein
MLSVIMLSVIMLSVIMLSGIVLLVVVPYFTFWHNKLACFRLSH